ncbi:hypothetical protein CcaverHIS002_0410790 [Cutaneotrichosporon cavernicola]|uniref:Cullin family profile domain-containing protein n=1 Tax=Cutaneotrichosporon cavernicola TaxID=279322 RepID=A0AA48QWA6_9TREE|nr:uncharacterized protein CcaverHIS019_0410690 [Cutaneotrichosporon cavernicola]BEI84475.1 hypothetical protein CcaverHIS002_0410790 [Cutaneotrichosporon cavernicola]BEI92249.1 hypothetical protein CcaverHIS019_0410690 [Cutaneotrichosporon cavernicola]BEJ00021.1 hypothetical protein CcaverHIS631_0410630 [Cutaneotrichosporon cavernicola]BEJ07793.1 hypothetical protein CcaverHIS641_0410620 [Cutaneotrichosporon cavernicola]
MASLFSFPSRTDAFSAYRPSRNAHTDILTASSSARTGRIVTLNVKPPKPPLDDASKLAAIQAQVPLVLSGKSTEISFNCVSDFCRNLVLYSEAPFEAMYRTIDMELEKSTERIARGCRAAIMAREAKWLEVFVSTWETYIELASLLSAVFVYLDRVHAKDGSGIPTIIERATAQFRQTVWGNKLIFEKTKDDILAWAASERASSEVDLAQRVHVKSVVSIAKNLGTFSTLARPLMEVTQEYYEDLAATHAANVQDSTLTGIEFVKWALDKEVEERERAEQCFSPETAVEVVDVFRHVTGEMVADKVVRQALDESLYRADTDALSRLFVYSQQAKAFKVMAKAVHDHIETRIRTVIADPSNDRQMIESVFKLKRFVDKAVADLFEVPAKPIEAEDGDVEMEGAEAPKLSQEERNKQLELEEAVRSGFKAGLGSRKNAPAEWIAKYLDSTMRKGQGSTSEAEFNVLLDEIVALIGYTPDRDVFRAFYTSGLAKRLLLNKSASDDMERTMIVKLQKEMGEEFTTGDVMLKDLQLSETLVKSYQSARAKDPSKFKDDSDFTANVLTESAWPSYPLLKDGWNFKLTPQLQSSIDTFTEWYATQHKNRMLSWRHQLGTVTLTAVFDSGRYEIGVSLFQAVALLQFNDDDVLDFTELKSRTGIEASELVRTLQSLSMGRKGTRVLIKRPAGKEVEPTDKFAFNKGFTSERMKFKINQIQQDLSAEESRQTNEQVALDRVSVLEATIVRIMKGRKKLTLQLLIDAVVSDVSKRFPPDVKEIKKRVESLIDREFLKRDDEDKNMLHYLA